MLLARIIRGTQTGLSSQKAAGRELDGERMTGDGVLLVQELSGERRRCLG